jgi:hypothetical protein
MVRMLFLRDIDVDVRIRCRACGHGAVLPLDAMVRRFGPSYPVLSIAPHFRCSRCHSRDTESLPAPPEAAAPPARPMPLPAAAFVPPPPEPEPETRDAEEPDAFAVLRAAFAPIAEAAEAEETPPPVSDPPTGEDGWSFARLFGRRGEPDEDAVPADADAPLPAPWPVLSDPGPVIETVAEPADDLPEEDGWTLSRLLGRRDEPEEDAAPEVEMLAETGEPPPAFAIRDPERPTRAPVSADDEEDGASPQLRDAMAVLRGLVEDAAGEPLAAPAPLSIGAPPPPADEPPPRRPVREADSFENTLSKLRSLLDLDTPADEPPPAPRGGNRLFRRRKSASA